MKTAHDGRTPRAPTIKRARSTANRASIVRRMWRAADAQVRAVEARLKHDEQASDERERDARVLAVLSRTLRELTALEAAQATPQRNEADDGSDGAPFDLDELRRALEGRLAGLRHGGSRSGDCGASA